MSDAPVPPETVQCAVRAECDHHWISAHQPGHRVYWVRQCSICHEVDWDGLDVEVAAAVAAERERGGTHVSVPPEAVQAAVEAVETVMAQRGLKSSTARTWAGFIIRRTGAHRQSGT